MQLRAIRTLAFTGRKKNLSRCQHTQGWREEIDPEGVPVVRIQCWAECPGGFVLIPDKGASKAMYEATKIAAK